MTGRVLAIDPGTQRIGVAISDPGGTVAMPLVVLPAGPEFLGRLADISEANQVIEVVVGLPRTLGGAEGPQAQSARSLAADIERRLDLPVRLVDERLTTAAAARSFDEAGVTQRNRRNRIDKVAAAMLLQGYLDSRRSS